MHLHSYRTLPGVTEPPTPEQTTFPIALAQENFDVVQMSVIARHSATKALSYRCCASNRKQSVACEHSEKWVV
jgi:hypothetical protein